MKNNFLLTLLVALFCGFTSAWAQTNVKGSVVDQGQMPIPGANIIVVGTTEGAVSDFDGNFTISAKQGDVLVFSFVGYVNKEVSVGASDQINVMVTNTANVDIENVNIYPNPATTKANLEFELPKSDKIQIEIIDLLGKQVHFEDKGSLPAGVYNFPLNLDHFSQGIYFLTIRSDDQIKSIKFIKE